MIISLIGYMGSGKSHISKLLSEELKVKLFDLDFEISKKNRLPIPEIFEKKGEIFFRKQERELLEAFFATQSDGVLSLGGGTPAYYNNMQLINQNSKSFFLQTSIKLLIERLMRQKEKRPLIAKLKEEDVPEFVAKHLFERNPYYSKAQYKIITDHLKPEEIVKEIIALI